MLVFLLLLLGATCSLADISYQPVAWGFSTENSRLPNVYIPPTSGVSFQFPNIVGCVFCMIVKQRTPID